MGMMLVVVAAALIWPPEVPPAVQTIEQEGRWVLRTNDPAMPLYTHDPDPAETATCLGPCAKSRPPLSAPAGAVPVGEWRPIARADGRRQWSFRGKPVYLHVGDGISVPRGVTSGWRLLPTFDARSGQGEPIR